MLLRAGAPLSAHQYIPVAWCTNATCVFTRVCLCVCVHSQLRKDRDLLQARVEGLEAEVERDRGLHRRELRRKAKESQEVG